MPPEAPSMVYDFMLHAVLAGLMAAVLCGVVGTFVVVKRLVFISGGVSHAAFGGLGLFFFLGLDPRLGAAAVALAVALVLAGAGEGRGRSYDAVIGILWSVGMALGVVFLYKSPGYAPSLMTYLFGNILAVERSDVLWTLGLVTAVLILFALFSRELVAVAFDEAFAAVQGVAVRRFHVGLMVAVALSVVFLIQLVGIVLVIALLTIPPVIGLRLAASFPAVVAIATACGVAMTLGGLAVSYAFDLPSGPAIVLLGAAGLLTLVAAQRLRLRQPPTPPPSRALSSR